MSKLLCWTDAFVPQAFAAFLVAVLVAATVLPFPQSAFATTCDAGSVYMTTECIVYLTTTGLGTWTVPADWNNSSNSVEVIGGGAGGEGSGGGGGGGYSKVTSLSLSGTASYTVGAGGSSGGNGGSTFFNGATCGGSSICATGGSTGAGAGGSASVGSGHSGGSGAGFGCGVGDGGGGGAAGQNGNGWNSGSGACSGANQGGGGGGGADAGSGSAGSAGSGFDGGNGGSGPTGTAGGTGSDGATTAGAPGSNGSGGGGGSLFKGAWAGGNGGAGTEWDSSHGSGGGGGGSSDAGGDAAGGTGGLYGGGGGSSSSGGAGAQGIIVIIYTPLVAPTVTTNSAESFTPTNATLFGSITTTGGANATQSGFAYGTVSNLSSVIATTTLGSQTGTVTFSDSSPTGLSSGTTYYFRAYATNGGGTGYGSILNFTTGNTLTARTMLLFQGFRIKLVSGALKLY